MNFSFQCPACNKALSATEKHIGRDTKCPSCNAPVSVPEPQAEIIDRSIRQTTDFEHRLVELERRVAVLEEGRLPFLEVDQNGMRSDSDESRSLISARLTNKRFQPQNPDLGQYNDFVWFDCFYLPQDLTKPTRAIKGTLEFSDLFGEVKFQLGVTINERLEPKRPYHQKGVGFEYNQFMDAHQWMVVTDESDMLVKFKVTNILFEDKTTKSFA